ncbi:ParB/RepB/Spo0J family partition protein [Ancylothrix sp. C2]|uniref:ParB/RepB/Spo0J family partition protein n=1 Tax=Ancylothrix sp. D3o TaxID=2953691 RepID=UPI0021BA4691|nr:ParB/RepB/Spo0J family partition protein [Ancylothrix sp. D3o]MCT7953299.1 ParB/RepB/Spo0J family partition protein [Ancylothrix sp. D3o]
MSKKAQIDISNLFSGAEYSQEVHALETKISELQAEIQQLRSQGSQQVETKVQELRSTLTSAGVIDISVEQIDPNPDQPRQTFSTESINGMMISLASDGQQEPVILIEKPDGRHLLFDGERRWRAASQLQWSTIKAVIIPCPEALHRRVLLANLHRENLNPLDMAEALIKQIAQVSNLNIEDIPRILRTAVRRLERQGKITRISEIVVVSPEEQQEVLAALELNSSEKSVLSVLLSLQLNPTSINTNIFPMLGLATDLKQAIRTQGLGGIQALTVQRCNAKTLGIKEPEAKKVRAKLIKRILQEKLSVAKTRALVSKEISHYQKEQSKEQPASRATGIIRQVREMAIDNMEQQDLKALKEALASKLNEIEVMLSAE